MAIALADSEIMRDCKLRYFGRDTSTDVISQLYEREPGAGIRLAEVLVNAEWAAQAPAHLGGPSHELALYLAHGLHHIGGATDDTPAGRRAMRRTELRWLCDAVRLELLKGLCHPWKPESSA